MKNIKLQSFTDIVTNSSTEIFSACTQNTVKHVYSLINMFMRQMHCDEDIKAEDIFKVTLASSTMEECWVESILENCESYVELDTILCNENINYETPYERKLEFATKMYNLYGEKYKFKDCERTMEDCVKCGEGYYDNIKITPIVENTFGINHEEMETILCDLVSSIEMTEVMC